MNFISLLKRSSQRAVALRVKTLCNGPATFRRVDSLFLATPSRKTRSVWMTLCLSGSVLLASQLAGAADVYASTDANGLVRWSTQAWDSSYTKVITSNPTSLNGKGASPSKGKRQSANAQKLQERRSRLYPLVDSVTRRFAMDTEMIMALIEVESGFDPQAVSAKGARGLMQLMPGTAAGYGVRDARQLHDPQRNLDIGVRHLKKLLDLHGGQWTLALSAYNAGQGAVARHGQRIPGYTETMLYVPAVLAKAARLDTQGAPAAPVLLSSAE